MEAHFSPTVFRQRLARQPIAEAFRKGLDAAPSVGMRLIAELGRNLGPEQRIPLELCPLSNLRTEVVTSVADHPLRRYFDAGIPVSLNTDDPLFFGNTLVDEMVAAQQLHRFTRDDLKRLVLSAVLISWLTSDAKAALLRQFRGMSVWNEVA